MSYETDHLAIDGFELSISRNDGKINPKSKGNAFGVSFRKTDNQDDKWYSREEALEIRDYITKHLGESNA